METRPLLQAGAARPRPFAALTTPVQEEEKEKGEGKQARRRCQERGLQQPWQHRAMRREGKGLAAPRKKRMRRHGEGVGRLGGQKEEASDWG
jgi:hypothetical protein